MVTMVKAKKKPFFAEESGNIELAAGGTLGVLAAAETLASAAVCPLCIVAAPLFLGLGAYKRMRCGKAKK
jgi:hypothetical protein